MFEKEAEEYADENDICVCDEEYWSHNDIKQAYQKGAEFGYNKATEWHYVKDGDLPKEDTIEKETLYLLWFGLNDSDYLTGVFSHGRFWCFDSGWFETKDVIAWKEIVLPELKE